MNVGAAITIFVIIAISGAIVVPFALVLVRKRAKGDDPRAKESASPLSIVVTVSVLVAAMIFGFAGPAIFPNTWWSALMGTLMGKAIYVGALLAVTALLLPLLQTIGALPKDQNDSTYETGSRWRNHEQE